MLSRHRLRLYYVPNCNKPLVENHAAYTVKGTDDSLRGGRHISSNSYKVSRKERKYTVIPECPDSREKGERIMLFHRKRKRRRGEEEKEAAAAAKANFSNCRIQNGMRQLLKSKLAVTRVTLRGFTRELNLRL